MTVTMEWISLIPDPSPGGRGEYIVVAAEGMKSGGY